MNNVIKQPYELSLWRDVPMFHALGEASNINYPYSLPAGKRLEYQFFEEQKIITLGTSEHNTQSDAINLKLVSNINGSNTLTFDLYYEYFDENTGEVTHNPAVDLVVNEAKLKLRYGYKRAALDVAGNIDNTESVIGEQYLRLNNTDEFIPEWYDLVVKSVVENSKEKKYSYTTSDFYINELSTSGYGLVLSTELKNNSGNAIELGRKITNGSEWDVLNENGQDKDGNTVVFADGLTPHSANLQQLSEEALYECNIVSGTTIYAKADSGNVITIPASAEASSHILIFYNTLVNKLGFFQFFYSANDNYLTDDTRVIRNLDVLHLTTANGDILEPTWITDTSFPGGYRPSFVQSSITFTNFRGKRPVRSAATTYDTVVEQTVTKYRKEGDNHEYRGYTTSEIVDAVSIKNYFINSTNIKTTADSWEIGQYSVPSYQYAMETVIEPPYVAGQSYGDYYYHSALHIKSLSGRALDNKIAILNKGLVQTNLDAIVPGMSYVFRFKAYSKSSSTGNIRSGLDKLSLTVAEYTESNGTYTLETIYFQGPSDDSTYPRPINYQISYPMNSDVHYGCYFSGATPFFREYLGTSGSTILYEDWTIFDSEGIYVHSYSYIDETTATPIALKTNWIDYRVNGNGALTQSWEKFYYQVFTPRAALTTNDMAEKQVGLFISPYTTGAVEFVEDFYLEDVQFYPFYLDPDSNEPMQLSSVQEPKFVTKYHYYKYDSSITDKTKIAETVTADAPDSSFITVYNETYTKVRELDLKNSMTFNSIQTLCETFECWAKFLIDHDPLTGKIQMDYNKWVAIKVTSVDGSTRLSNVRYYEKNAEGVYIDITDNTSKWSGPNHDQFKSDQDYYYKVTVPRQRKYITFNEYAGFVNNAGFKYGVNMTGITRTLDSKKIVSKLIVAPNSNEQAENGMCTIATASSNLSGETFLLNFNYYYSQGLLNPNDVDKDLYATSEGCLGYYPRMSHLNQSYLIQANAYNRLSTTVAGLTAEQTTLSEQITQTQAQIEDLKDAIETVTGIPYATIITKSTSSLDSSYAKEKIATINDLTRSMNAAKNNLKNVESQLLYTQPQLEEYSETMADLLQQKKNLNNQLFAKYSRFLQEGTWIDENYRDPELYYLDAVDILSESNTPNITYTINVIDISAKEGYENYAYGLGARTYVEDPEFFGYAYTTNTIYDSNIINERVLVEPKTPFHEEVVITEFSHDLNAPEKDTLKITTYKNQFADFFQKIAASTTSLQYSTGSYNRASSVISSSRTIDGSVLSKSLDNISLAGKVSTENVVYQDTDVNHGQTQYVLKVGPSGILLSTDGGSNWTTAISGQGINANSIVSGTIDTNVINIYSGTRQGWLMDGNGLTAYSRQDPLAPTVDFSKRFVRYDGWGMYGMQNTNDSYVPSSLAELKSNANALFGFTWDGFFLRSIYPSLSQISGRLDISPEKDITFYNSDATHTDIPRLLIGRLNPTQSNEYGIRIRNMDGAEVFSVSDQGILTLHDANNDNYQMRLGYAVDGYKYNTWTQGIYPPVPYRDSTVISETFTRVIAAGTPRLIVDEQHPERTQLRYPLEIYDDGTFLGDNVFLNISNGGGIRANNFSITSNGLEIGGTNGLYVTPNGYFSLAQNLIYNPSTSTLSMENGVIKAGYILSGVLGAMDTNAAAYSKMKELYDKYETDQIKYDGGLVVTGEGITWPTHDNIKTYQPGSGTYPVTKFEVQNKKSINGDTLLPAILFGLGNRDDHSGRGVIRKYGDGLFIGQYETGALAVQATSETFLGSYDNSKANGLFINFNSGQIYAGQGNGFSSISGAEKIAVFG